MTRAKTSRETLKALLKSASPGLDEQQVAEELFSRYGSFAPIVESHADDLKQTRGLTPAAAQALSLVPHLSRYAALERFGPRPKLDTEKPAGSYLAARYLGLHYEHCYLLNLDRQGLLIDCSLIQQGTVDETPFYIRLLLESALRSNAYAVVFSHNHPGGSKNVSLSDISTTRAAVRAFAHIGIYVLDHLVLSDGQAISIRREDGETERLIRSQSAGNGMIEGWSA